MKKMETLIHSIKNISYITGEFKDSALEQSFYSYLLQETTRYSRRYILALGILFQIFVLPDYTFLKERGLLYVIFLMGMLFLLISILYYLRIPHMSSSLYLFSSIYEIVAILFFIILFLLCEHQDIVVHQQGLIVFIFVIFLILPNRFINKIILSTFLTGSFFYIAISKKLISSYIHSGSLIIFTIVVIFFCAFSARFINRLQRIQFQDSLALERLSTTDTLTKAYNRRKYDQDLEKEISRSQRYKIIFSGIIFDLDNFKEVNDNYGHLMGDEVLKKISSQVKEVIRENDELYRWGGEEFIIILPNTDQESATELANRVKSYLENTDFSPVHKLTCSFGVTSWQEEDSVVSFTDRLDHLLYLAKKKGKDRIVTQEF